MDKFHGLIMAVTDQVNSHPITTSVAGVATTIVALLQSAQTVAGTLIAFFTSIAGVVTVLLQMRRAWRNRNKD